MAAFKPKMSYIVLKAWQNEETIMFLETSAARTCFSNVSHFCHTGGIVSQRRVCFQEAKFASATRQKHYVFPRGMEAWQNEKTIMHVSGNMFARFARPFHLNFFKIYYCNNFYTLLTSVLYVVSLSLELVLKFLLFYCIIFYYGKILVK